MTDELKPCRDAFEEWWKNTDEDMYGAEHAAWVAFRIAWNRRSGEPDCKVCSALHYAKHQHTTLLAAVRGVRDGLLEAGAIEHNSRAVRAEMNETADDLTRILDEAQSVTKRVGTGASTKAVTVHPDE